ncbi:MAG: PH domain-containing protein [Bacilli bacterium]|nr:PH domain-containing protein [Bacilli bacterium]MDD4808886.1 PH domain-containing protein [Bacilli bacterium]
MKSPLYDKLKTFKRKYPLTICWRLKSHAKIIDMHLNPGEEVRYAFAAQKNDSFFDIISTYVVVLTNKRILLGQKRLLFGYFYIAITPDMFSDLNLSMGLIWGKVYIDTIKEVVVLSKIERDALPEIETEISEYMMEEKKKYAQTEKK